MQVSLEAATHRYLIRAYGPGEITVLIPRAASDPAPEALDAIGPHAARFRQEVVRGSLIVTPGKLIRDWPPRRFEELAAGHMAAVAALEPEVVILGCGARLQWPPASVLEPLVRSRIGYEIMDTAAACRTYNILMADERRVAAALLMI